MKLPILGHDISTATKAQSTLSLADGRPIDYAVQPPPECKGDLVTHRPCDRYACRYQLAVRDEREGRPHSPGARPPAQLSSGPHARGARALKVLPSCMWDKVNSNPEGMTADDVGVVLGGVVGERILQVENRGLLKMKAIDHVCAVLEAARPDMPRGTELELVMAHNDHALPNQHFVTVSIRVKEQTAKGGVIVRRKK